MERLRDVLGAENRLSPDRQGLTFIGGDGILLLYIRDVRVALSVEFIEVNHIVLGLFGMYGEVGVIAFVGIEG